MIDPDSLPYRPNVGVMLFDRRGALFLARRADLPEIWQCPQGGIDEGETPEQAALRELREETGLETARLLGAYPGWLPYDLPAHLIGKALGGRYRGQTQRWFALRMTMSDDAIDLAGDGTEPPEFVEWRWVMPDDVPGYDLGFKQALYARILPVLSEMAPAEI
ncbi:RNA pyrophosphohydrolase [Swaminathania salitolerans]|uniref:RNA pyrophosphohydrolase n=1 Tax=Swaminathania salitolerans TaxID=182838 RepID=A0A511BUS8_9PROT|nr:RNA pyrophosphohydrolase [Swaminathania salitolerans]GBQ13968.1 dinucleoside polyphosphate hydrolase [Swaminathania salitolerans LMG 21291]GEL03244.1 RNA pyrophosphohydrolase [Swaminathania salitolerans]